MLIVARMTPRTARKVQGLIEMFEIRMGGLPPDLASLNADLKKALAPNYVGDMVLDEKNAAACRRSRARKRGEDVPLLKGGRPRKAA